MPKKMLAVLGVVMLAAPVFANTTASTCMNITVTVEKFVMAAWGPDVSLTITQSEIELHPTDAKQASATPVPGTLHVQTNFDCDAKITLHPAVGGNGPAPETLLTGVQPTSLLVDGVDMFSQPWWPNATMWTMATYSVSDIDLGPTAIAQGTEYALPGRDYQLGFNVTAANMNSNGQIPAWGTYSGKLCVVLTPEEDDGVPGPQGPY